MDKSEFRKFLGQDSNKTMDTHKRTSSSTKVADKDPADTEKQMRKLVMNEKYDGMGEAASWRSEWKAVILLFFLYILQGIPLGISSAFTMFLQNQKVSYSKQALFSFATWPFSIKFLWAPIVDSLYLKSCGRRKSWLIPMQYLIGIFLLILSYHLHSWFGANEPDVGRMTIVFAALSFLAATQDIAVDGWALTMLSRRNVGHASTCNSVGQTAGMFLGYVLFLALESKDFANAYVFQTPQETGLVTIEGYLRFWAIVFFVTTTLVALLKQEESSVEEHDIGVLETYKATGRILTMPAVISTSIFLLTWKIGFGITDGATHLKLIEAGVPKEKLALLSIPAIPLQTLLPLFLARYVTSDRPLDVYVKAYIPRLLFGLVFALLVKWTSHFEGVFPFYYYAVIVVVYSVHQVFVYSCFVASMAFFARVSDPALGGTYMTLLNTLNNLGGNWPTTLAIWVLDFTTYKSCSFNGRECSSQEGRKECASFEGDCLTTLDGYYFVSVISVVIGVLWFLLYGKRTAQYIQRLKADAWTIPR
ncbi:acetyl-coenzyme A transporter 1-like [Tropilaelaps mercedesae]|uniref:Acetyl-coenzyme A transporter 1-like n=1 Tax=Tropilaelaps mercedesae TaxID=418985 RepID=A0A1V9WZU1_9ACAR|nr:acetyl-coenzyme A transporter 1-like [Tropilaelaps mercedesae]